VAAQTNRQIRLKQRLIGVPGRRDPDCESGWGDCTNALSDPTNWGHRSGRVL